MRFCSPNSNSQDVRQRHHPGEQNRKDESDGVDHTTILMVLSRNNIVEPHHAKLQINSTIADKIVQKKMRKNERDVDRVRRESR